MGEVMEIKYKRFEIFMALIHPFELLNKDLALHDFRSTKFQLYSQIFVQFQRVLQRTKMIFSNKNISLLRSRENWIFHARKLQGFKMSERESWKWEKSPKSRDRKVTAVPQDMKMYHFESSKLRWFLKSFKLSSTSLFSLSTFTDSLND